MIVNSLHLRNFTVFEDAKFDFCPGVNVLIGANGTGKTHVLKAMHLFLEGRREQLPDSDLGSATAKRDMMLELVDLFRPTSFNGGRLVRLGSSEAEVELAFTLPPWPPPESATITIDCANRKGSSWSMSGFYPQRWEASVAFIPSREVLSTFQGFVALWKKRELAFDKTYFYLCSNLDLPRLRDLENGFGDLVRELEGKIGGRLFLQDGQFFVELGDDAIEASLMPEGHRKLATILQLCANGSIAKDSVLFWDEPEANLNPLLISKTAEIIRRLASLGVQVFLTSHDYLLTSELSVAAEYGIEPKVPIRFFGLSREGDGPVTVQSGDTLTDIHDNPIVAEYAARYEREQQLFKIAHNW